MVEVRVMLDRICLFERQPGPTGGRADHIEIASLSIGETERLAAAIQSALRTAIEVAHKNAEEALARAEAGLVRAKCDVQALRDHMAALKEQQKSETS